MKKNIQLLKLAIEDFINDNSDEFRDQDDVYESINEVIQMVLNDECSYIPI